MEELHTGCDTAIVDSGSNYQQNTTQCFTLSGVVSTCLDTPLVSSLSPQAEEAPGPTPAH